MPDQSCVVCLEAPFLDSSFGADELFPYRLGGGWRRGSIAQAVVVDYRYRLRFAGYVLVSVEAVEVVLNM
jgi:hypothetical protein